MDRMGTHSVSLNDDTFSSPVDDLLESEDVTSREIAVDRLEKARAALEGRPEPVTAYKHITGAMRALQDGGGKGL